MTRVGNRAVVLVAALLALLGYAVFAVRPALAWDPLQKARRAASAGQRALAAGDSTVALESMLRAQALAPRDPAIGAGLAETFYDTGEYESSIRQLEPLATDEAPARQRQRALYNAGNAAFRMQDLERALDLFTEALVTGEGRADPDLLHNLELTQRLLQEQQQQDQQGEDGEPQDQDQDQDQEQDQQQQEQQPGDPQQEQQPPPEQDQQQESGEEQQEQQQPQDQQTPPDEASEQDAQAAPPQVETMTPEEAMRLLQALDFDEEELRKSIQRRLRGDDEENEHDW